MSKLVVSLSPHAHSNDSLERNMYGVIIALIPALIVSFIYFGIGSAIVCATSVIAAIATEWVSHSNWLIARFQSPVKSAIMDYCYWRCCCYWYRKNDIWRIRQ